MEIASLRGDTIGDEAEGVGETKRVLLCLGGGCVAYGSI